MGLALARDAAWRGEVTAGRAGAAEVEVEGEEEEEREVGTARDTGRTGER